MLEDNAMDKVYDYLAECGCYELGDMLYDREGDFTHMLNEECIN